MCDCSVSDIILLIYCAQMRQTSRNEAILATAKSGDKKTETKKNSEETTKTTKTKRSTKSQKATTSKTSVSKKSEGKAKQSQKDASAVKEYNLEELAENLSSASRKDRQNSAAIIAEISKGTPEDLLAIGDAIVDALKRPEARTRWESFDALTNLVEFDSKLCRKALDAAEESVFDEESGTVRLAAMRFLCKLGSASPRLANSTWPLIDEALQCYHGDPEYTDMLVAVNDFAASKLPKQVREELIERMEFDATNAKSGLLRRANSIIDAARGSVGKKKKSAEK